MKCLKNTGLSLEWFECIEGLEGLKAAVSAVW